MLTASPPSTVDATRVADFECYDHLGAAFRLTEHLGQGPLLVVFFRGHWCPYCRRYLGKLRDHFPRLRARGAQLVAISPEPPATSRALATELSLPFRLLSDPAGAVIDSFGVRNGFRAAHSVLPHASVFLLDASGVVRFHSIDRNYKKRTTVRTILGWLDEIGAAGGGGAAPVPGA